MVIPSKYLTPLLEIEWFDRRKLFGNPSTNLESPNAWSRYGFERHNKQICFATSEEAGHGGPSSIIPLQNILFCGMLISLKSTSHLLTALFQQRATTKIKENPTSVFANQGSYPPFSSFFAVKGKCKLYSNNAFNNDTISRITGFIPVLSCSLVSHASYVVDHFGCGVFCIDMKCTCHQYCCDIRCRHVMYLPCNCLLDICIVCFTGSSGIRTPSASNFPFTYAYTNVSSSSPSYDSNSPSSVLYSDQPIYRYFTYLKC
nr:PREDICTED: uncharacterized protein LOC108208006 isoform X1 [Daucus carota subsp. sativus]XP_017234803.1 PREDICTED: uncharacterized protein LOC108208788 isoform X1 [Daucus carota subsp. sativus]